MPKLPRFTAAEAEQLLLRAGFIWVRSQGSHRIYRRETERMVLPFHAGRVLHPLRDEAVLNGMGKRSWERTNELLDGYLNEHHAIFDPPAVGRSVKFSGLVRRLALSCLVDGDHSDTAQHYREERELDGPPLRPTERLEALDRFVEVAKRGDTAAFLVTAYQTDAIKEGEQIWPR